MKMESKAQGSILISTALLCFLASVKVSHSLLTSTQLLNGSSECDYRIYVNDPIQLHSTRCGSVYTHKADHMYVELMAPTDMHTTHYFSLEVMCFGSCTFVYVMIGEKDFGDTLGKKIYFKGMPFSYDTIGSYKVVILINSAKNFRTRLILKFILKGPTPKPGFDITNIAEYITFGSSSYRFYKGNGTKKIIKSWTEANAFCEKKGGTLLAINSRQEYSFIQRMIRRLKLDIYRNVLYLGLATSEEGFRWSDGTPGILTDWYKDELADNTEDVKVSINLTMDQPTNDPSCQCTAMFSLGKNSGPMKWFLVPCHVPYFQPIVICEFQKINKMHDVYLDKINTPLTGTSLLYNGNFTKLIRSFVKCRKGWIFMGGRCFKLISSTGKIDISMSCSDARALCTQGKGFMASTNVDVHRKLLHILLHKPNYGSLWLGNCNTLTYDLRRSTWILAANHDTIYFPVNNVMCESEPVKIKHACPTDQFQCKDGTCILGTHCCDHRLDCFEGEDEWDCACKEDDFRCEDGRCIPYSKYCNLQQDCFDNSDEKNCTFIKCPKGYRQFRNGSCVKMCTFGDNVIACLEDGSPIIENGICRAFTCKSGECLPNVFVKNMRVDCPGQEQEDEILAKYEYERGAYKNYISGIIKDMDPYCPNGRGTQTRCRLDHVHCFERDLACIYDVDRYGFMSGCPDGEHLRDCSSFECPQMFKCPESYCIPYHKVCDGKRDCTSGEDETSCSKFSCPGLFRCRAEGLCLDQSLVCDGIVHCKESFDDESTCSSKSCPLGCVCNGWTISCKDITNETLRDIPYLVRVLRLTNNKHFPLNLVFENYIYLGKLHVADLGIHTIESRMFENLHNLLLLDIRDNQISHLMQGMFYGLINLQHLDLSGNPIKSLGEGAFKGLTSIRYLSLENLGIKSVADGTFQDLFLLKKLYLKNNYISHVSYRTWKGLSDLKVLDIRQNLIENIDSDLFDGLKLNEFHTDHFVFCCLVDVNICKSEADAFSSCSDLIATGILKIAIWVLGVAALVGNILVIIVRAISKEKQTVSVLIINLSFSDLLMGVYLLIIAAADTHFRGEYMYHADSWLTSDVCKTAGFLSTLSSEMSVFMLTVITADRLQVFIFPFSMRRLSLKSSLLIILSGWVFFASLSALPVLNLSYFGTTYIKNGVCLLFNIAEGKTQGWEYSLSVVTVFNLIALLFVFISYICIYCSLNKSRKRANRDLSQADIDLVKRFLLIVVTDFICWMPIILIALLSFGGFPVSPSVTAWVAIFILPVNSALNPFLYTFSSLKHIKKLKKKSHRVQ